MSYLRKTLCVCIPCIYEHIKYLKDCLNSIMKQSFQPHEIVIVISNIPKDELDLVKEKVTKICAEFTFPGILTDFTEERKYAGENRNRAISLSNCDIISLIDADDLMRYDRLDVIYKVFDMDDSVIGVLHKFYENIYPEPEQQHINFDPIYIKKYMYDKDLHFGHASFLRTLFNEYQYTNKPRGQDIEFVHNILGKYIKNLRIYDQKLSYYISNHSTFYSKNGIHKNL